MVHVVITVLAVSANAVKIRNAVEVFLNDVEVIVGAKISRIGFLDADAGCIENVLLAFDNAH